MNVLPSTFFFLVGTCNIPKNKFNLCVILNQWLSNLQKLFTFLFFLIFFLLQNYGNYIIYITAKEYLFFKYCI